MVANINQIDRLRILHRIVINQTPRYKQIALEFNLNVLFVFTSYV
jgi:hypothetical protein